MVIKFSDFRNNRMSAENRELIEYILLAEFNNPDSYYSTLQILYNNPLHFNSPNANFGICTYENLKQIHNIAISKNDVIEIQGDVHSNHHSSAVLIKYPEQQPMFVEDTYIRCRVSGGPIIHIMVKPPTIDKFCPYRIYFHKYCDNVSALIAPIVRES